MALSQFQKCTQENDEVYNWWSISQSNFRRYLNSNRQARVQFMLNKRCHIQIHMTLLLWQGTRFALIYAFWDHSNSQCGLEVNVARSQWWLGNTGLGNVLMPSGTKPLHKPVLTKICHAICRHSAAGPALFHGLTLIPAWISNYMPGKVWGEITYPFLNFNGCTVEV